MFEYVYKHKDKDDNPTGEETKYIVGYYGSIELHSAYAEMVRLTSIADAIDGLIWLGQNDFVPPLPYRRGSSGTASVTNKENRKQDALDEYRDLILGQKNILVFVPAKNENAEDKLVAFMSFRHDCDIRDFLSKDVKAGDKINYVTTIIVHPEHRRRGLTSKLYDYMESLLPTSVHAKCVSTRTWHTNTAHNKLLEKKGYELTCTLHGQREYDGNPYDTVFYCKLADREQEAIRRIHGV